MKHKIFILSILIFATALFAQTQNGLKNGSSALRSKIVNAERLLKDAETLAADEMQGRAAGTEGSAKAREFILKRFWQVSVFKINSDFVIFLP